MAPMALKEQAPEGEGAGEEPAAEGREKRILIDFAFKLTIEHGSLGVREMFAAAEAFDFYEVRGVAGENLGKPRRALNVDVLEVSSTATTVHVTPARAMTYAEIAAEIEVMVEGIAKHHLPGGKAQGVRVQWLIMNTGIASDMRGRLAVVH